MKKVKVLVQKEWSEVFKNRFVFFTVAFMPLLLTALPLITLYEMRSPGDLSGISSAQIPAEINGLCQGLNEADCNQYTLVVQFMILFMMLPIVIPITIASYSIVGEKATRTLEPLLATPITTWELLTGKALAAVIPAVLATWGGYLIYVIGAWMMKVSPSILAKFFEPVWILAIVVLGPLLALAGVSLAVMISSRANDPRIAEQIAGLFVLPIVGLMGAQAAGAIVINQTMIAWIAFGLVIIDAGLLAFATQLFQRETILTRWK